MAMEEIRERAKELCAQMTLQEKAGFLAGEDFWHTKALARLEVEPIRMADGPHGLRKQETGPDGAAIAASTPATCFPTASALACTFDEALARRVGEALGEECREQGVDLLLGPGVNMKRSPLCGRNFEYFSEDPLLAGKLAAAYISGVQSRGVGACVKHFAANNQEKARLITDSVVDERALREIYLPAFEIAVREARPWAVMAAYNLLNGTYCCEDRSLLEDTLRRDWDFDGAVISDWGAVNDCAKSVAAGMDLLMPGPAPDAAQRLVAAVESGEVPAEALDDAVRNVLTLVLRAVESRKTPYTCDMDAHLALAREAAEEAAVLLKNNGVLPMKPGSKFAVIGAFAKRPRYQGAGSSRVNPTKLDSAYEAFESAGLTFDYADGYSLEDDAVHEDLLDAAVEAARGQDVVFLFAGLPDSYEGEGFDRKTLGMPESHNRLIERVCAANENTVVVLQAGAPVKASWADQPAAILMCYLGGCQGGSAAVRLLLGERSPSGKLAETFPRNLSDTPSADNYPAVNGVALYRESIFIGYRYYDAAKKKVRWPFGYGLSYTTFEYSDLRLDGDSLADGPITAHCTVKNTGDVPGDEIVQVYVSPQIPILFCPPRQLRAFARVSLAPGESKEVSFTLGERAFQYYDVKEHGWRSEGGVYNVEVAASSRDIRLSAPVDVPPTAEPRDLRKVTPLYYERGGFSNKEFSVICGRALPQGRTYAERPFGDNSTMGEVANTVAGRRFMREVRREVGGVLGVQNMDEDEMATRLEDMPLRQLLMYGYPRAKLETWLNFLNGNYVQALRGWLGK